MVAFDFSVSAFFTIGFTAGCYTVFAGAAYLTGTFEAGFAVLAVLAGTAILVAGF